MRKHFNLPNKYDAFTYCQRVIRSCNGNMKYYSSVCNLIDNFEQLYGYSSLVHELRLEQFVCFCKPS